MILERDETMHYLLKKTILVFVFDIPEKLDSGRMVWILGL